LSAGSLPSLADEVLARCDRLALCTEEPGRITRPFLCSSAKEVHRLVSDWMREAGMFVEVDSIGNVDGLYPGSRSDGPTFLIGSHLDTVPNAGRYDGILGVLLGIAAVKSLAGKRLPFAIEVIGFSEEEGIRFRTSYLGSKVLVGQFDAALFERQDSEGISLRRALEDFGLDPEDVVMQQIGIPQFIGYLEAHIEQGPVLEAANLPLGVVEAIAGQSRLWLHFDGKAGHAGTEPMTMRRDALVAASEFVVAVNGLARSVAGLVATVGTLSVEPGAVNVVPGKVHLSLDVRHGDDPARENAVSRLLEIAAEIARKRSVSVEVERREQHGATRSDPRLATMLSHAAESLGHRPLRMVSGAGHDAVVMAGVCPMTMLFLRSIGGISHHPDEAVHPADVHAALDVMTAFLERLAGECP
jgi:allantoate deiminase